MSKKLILTETQYDKLFIFINESRFDKVIKDVIRVGDIVRIEYKNSVSNFKVVDSVNGQIIMDNIDSGSANINYRYFITTTSLRGDDLEIRRVHKIKEKDKLKDVKLWQKLDVKDVKNIEVLRNNTVIDTVDSPEPTNIKLQTAREKGQKRKPASEEFKTKVDDVILVFLNDIKEGNGVNLNTITKEVISLCCVSRGGNKFTFTLDSDTKIDDLKNWDTFGIEFKGGGEQEYEDLYELNKDIIKTTDGGETFNILFRANSGKETKEISFNNLLNIVPTPKCISDTEETNTNDTAVEKSDVDSRKEEIKDMMKVILNDPLMKKAFYRQPTLWNLLISALEGKNPKGTGIGPAMNVISQYGTAKNKKILGPNGNNFKVNKNAKFEVLNKEIFINPTGNPYDILRLSPNAEYDAMVNEYKLGDKHLTLSNKRLGFKIIVLGSAKDAPDTFEVSIVKVVKGKKTGEIKEYPKNAKIRFVNERGSGYSREETKKTD